MTAWAVKADAHPNRAPPRRPRDFHDEARRGDGGLVCFTGALSGCAWTPGTRDRHEGTRRDKTARTADSGSAAPGSGGLHQLCGPRQSRDRESTAEGRTRPVALPDRGPPVSVLLVLRAAAAGDRLACTGRAPPASGWESRTWSATFREWSRRLSRVTSSIAPATFTGRLPSQRQSPSPARWRSVS